MGRPAGQPPPPPAHSVLPGSLPPPAAAGSAGRVSGRAAGADPPGAARHVGGVRGPEAAGEGRDHAGRHPEGECKRRSRAGPGGCSCFLPPGRAGKGVAAALRSTKAPAAEGRPGRGCSSRARPGEALPLRTSAVVRGSRRREEAPGGRAAVGRGRPVALGPSQLLRALPEPRAGINP